MVTLQYVPYSEVENLTSVGRIRKLLNLAKANKIVLLQGRLKQDEEAELIKATMEEINKEFKGIELAVIEDNKKNTSGFDKFRQGFYGMLLGQRQGVTIIGPASIVKKVRKDPDKITLFTKEARRKRKS